jgi:hypothetical protein
MHDPCDVGLKAAEVSTDSCLLYLRFTGSPFLQGNVLVSRIPRGEFRDKEKDKDDKEGEGYFLVYKVCDFGLSKVLGVEGPDDMRNGDHMTTGLLGRLALDSDNNM